jgi:hypothetical protein
MYISGPEILNTAGPGKKKQVQVLCREKSSLHTGCKKSLLQPLTYISC